MHPPPFRFEHRLSDWPECFVEVRCPHCRATVVWPVGLLQRYGDKTFRELARALKCNKCRGQPAPVYLCAGQHRSHMGGPTPDWAIELVPPPV